MIGIKDGDVAAMVKTASRPRSAEAPIIKREAPRVICQTRHPQPSRPSRYVINERIAVSSTNYNLPNLNGWKAAPTA